ncbi:SGNH/GDSL hydrolase family protein [Streptomyces sp. NPDC053755]|uniref:SGNH/GDSL hydrolase family protein n=1 Tax=Streptomyces sp. NPDC053755 TaxID=3155815 RepID=UPI00343E9632
MTSQNPSWRVGAALLVVAALGALPLVAPSVSPDSSSGSAPAKTGRTGWHGAWAASPQAPAEPFGPNWSLRGFADQTVRQVVRVGVGGTRARIELSNRYGRTPLRITGATIARTDKGASVSPGSVRRLSFGTERSVAVPVGGTVSSDGVPFTAGALEAVTVTLYLAEPTGPATFHTIASATSYRAEGDHSVDTTGAEFRETSGSWYLLTGVEVSGGPSARRDGIVAFGDSITDGVGSGVDRNDRYPDELAERLAAAGRPRSVLNHGIGGNQLTRDKAWAGGRGVHRFALDALTEPNVGTVVVLEGINDIGADRQGAADDPTAGVSVDQLVAGHRELIRQARARGLRAIGATLTPIKGSRYDSPENEAQRDAFNQWVRASGAYDAVVDFDRALSDPADPDRLLPVYDSGDHLHPSAAGYRAMAEAIDLDVL